MHTAMKPASTSSVAASKLPPPPLWPLLAVALVAAGSCASA
jgi:hypothetical protein